MRVVIDTSSLLALVRYYLPFDKNNSLKNLIQQKIENHEIIILDKVITESKRTAKGIVIKELDFLDKKTFQLKTELILPEPSFITDLENRLSYGSQKNRLTEVEFENRKSDYLNSADAKLIIYCLQDKNALEIDKPILVTEETKAENDNKLFKKLPEICSMLEIECCNLPTLFKEHFKIALSKHLQ